VTAVAVGVGDDVAVGLGVALEVGVVVGVGVTDGVGVTVTVGVYVGVGCSAGRARAGAPPSERRPWEASRPRMIVVATAGTGRRRKRRIVR